MPLAKAYIWQYICCKGVYLLYFPRAKLTYSEALHLLYTGHLVISDLSHHWYLCVMVSVSSLLHVTGVEVSLAAPEFRVLESAGSASVCIDLTGAIEKDITGNITSSPGTALRKSISLQ